MGVQGGASLSNAGRNLRFEAAIDGPAFHAIAVVVPGVSGRRGPSRRRRRYRRSSAGSLRLFVDILG